MMVSYLVVNKSLTSAEVLGRDVGETVRQVQALQYADENKGEGCPANWKYTFILAE